eukprot:scaffold74902_cov78-Phaeocystis_antarctica.AAC.3
MICVTLSHIHAAPSYYTPHVCVAPPLWFACTAPPVKTSAGHMSVLLHRSGRRWPLEQPLVELCAASRLWCVA